MNDQNLSPPTIDVVLSVAEKFSDDTYDNLAQLISKPEATEPSDEDVEKFCVENSIQKNDLKYFLPLLNYLYFKTKDITQEDLLPSLERFIKDNGDDDINFERLAKKISELLNFREVQDAAQKRERLSRGFLPYLMSASSFVDIRHNFSRNNDGELDGQIGEPTTVIQLKLETNSPKAYERYSVFQLDRAAIKKLKKTLDEIDKKLKIIESR